MKEIKGFRGVREEAITNPLSLLYIVRIWTYALTEGIQQPGGNRKQSPTRCIHNLPLIPFPALTLEKMESTEQTRSFSPLYFPEPGFSLGLGKEERSFYLDERLKFDLDVIGLLKNLKRRLFEYLKGTWNAVRLAKILSRSGKARFDGRGLNSCWGADEKWRRLLTVAPSVQLFNQHYLY